MNENIDYKEKVESVAEDIKALVVFLDMFLLRHDLSDVDKMIENMEDHNSTLAAWPFPETMRKVELMKSQTDTFKAFRDLLKTRIGQMKIAKKPDTTPGQELLKALGF